MLCDQGAGPTRDFRVLVAGGETDDTIVGAVGDDVGCGRLPAHRFAVALAVDADGAGFVDVDTGRARDRAVPLRVGPCRVDEDPLWYVTPGRPPARTFLRPPPAC